MGFNQKVIWDKMISLLFEVNQKDQVSELIKEFHYSGRPVNSINTFSWHFPRKSPWGEIPGDCVAGAVFSSPPTRWSEEVIELLRLVRSEQDGIPPLTGLLSESLKWLKRNTQHDLIVSFADSTQGHHGGIYQAASWNFHGKRKRAMDGLIIDGTFVPGRTCNARYGTRSPSKLKDQRPDLDIEPHYDEGKYLYWKALNRNGKKKASRLMLESNEYVKE